MDEVADSFRVNFFAFACSQVEDSTEERKKKKRIQQHGGAVG